MDNKENIMTIQELYEWAVKNNVTDYKIEIQYRDDGGDYVGKGEDLYLIVEEEHKTVIL